MKKLISFLFRYSPSMVILAMLGGVITGGTNTALLAVVNKAIADVGHASKTLIWAFVGICIVLPLSRILAQYLLSTLSQKAIFDLRMHLSRRILAAPLHDLERHGTNKLYASLTGDVITIGNALTTLPMICMHLTIITTCLAYLFWLSWSAGIAVVVAMTAGMGLFYLVARKGHVFFRSSRKYEEHMFGHLRALTQGIKELKQHHERKRSFTDDHLEVTAEALRRNNVLASVYYASAGSISQTLFFIMLGITVFALPLLLPDLTPAILTGYIILLMYLIMPLQAMTGIGPTLGNAVIALKKVEDLGISLEKLAEETDRAAEPDPNWERLDYRGISHTYHREDEEQEFSLGPMDLAFRPGQLTFLVGGNGSGKTTLAKLIIGLYTPEQGTVTLDGEAITDENRESFRQYFTGVFSDFFLFETLLGMDAARLDDRARHYLQRLRLDHKVDVVEGRLTTTSLSQGQRKRLALLTAYLEDRPIYMFDEWAADQDPMFKELFYLALLPELKKRGKTILVISHDDHYYHLADRIIKLNYGQIEYDRPVTEEDRRQTFVAEFRS